MQFTEFANQTVLITGAASGIGQAQVRAFLAQQAAVIAIDIQAQPAALLASPKLSYQVADVSDAAQLTQAIMAGVSALGQPSIVCNTAGKLDDYRPTLKTSLTEWQTILATDLTSQFLVTNLVLPTMLTQKHGVFVNMASIAGLVAGGGGAAYTAAKHAIIGYTKQLDVDYAAQGIRANCIAPGAIDTPMNAADFAGDGKMAKWVAKETPAKRWAQPSEVADLTLFLASRHADYIHGTVVPIDGGWIAK
ncbi:3-oxoacyl-ACP reductase [Lactiplantibacillus fabifermentans]|uniref:3-ketoacyl-ACP reductase n=2 Tax=Lactiplantibacillus fabifermentans TaxID=483011 RepID=A0A0R2NNB2_9LACO|nr:3-oxoacyl-ACP reductase [Lactiplantibacillus fabifermentans]ETY73433.1 3-ketoacyl-ACP reductase [Lactiplantibacillus fabifermentans T30PCM01]KRO27209.1 3-ketoacyl-ACP reductase [Lactiplantibacillus fabifermentans DSM 21115]